VSTDASNFGYGYAPLPDSISIGDRISVPVPWQCHQLCLESPGCEGWTLEYFSLMNNLSFPQCSLYSQVKWSAKEDTSAVWQRISGDLTGDMPFKLRVSSADSCSVKGCRHLASSTPNFLGPWAQYRYRDGCQDSADCLAYPMTSQEEPTRCCALCGTHGTAPCDGLSQKSHGEYGPEPTKFLGWKDIWQGKSDVILSAEQTESTSGWGCWSRNYRIAIGSVKSFDFVNDPMDCLVKCAESSDCAAWSVKYSPKLAVLKSCELYSGVGKLESAVKDTEITTLVGVPQCLPALDYGTSKYLEFLREVSMGGGNEEGGNEEAHAEDVQDESPMSSPRLPSGEIQKAMMGLRESMNVMSNRLSHLVVIHGPSEAGVDSEIVPFVKNAKHLFGGKYKGELKYFTLPKSHLNEIMAIWQVRGGLDVTGATPLMSSETFPVTGLSVDCSNGMLSDRCILACPMKNGSPGPVGMMDVSVSFTFDVLGQTIDGIGVSDVLLIDRVCELLIKSEGGAKSSTTTTTTTTTTTLETCLSYGNLSRKSDIKPMSTPEARTAEECVDACKSTTGCVHMNFEGQKCLIKQKNDAGIEVVIDSYYVDSSTRCTDDCAADSECHSAFMNTPVCLLFDKETKQIDVVGPTMLAATGPSTDCSHKDASLKQVVSLDVPARNYTRDVGKNGVNSITVDDFTPSMTLGADGCYDGYMKMGGRCLKIVNDRLSFQDAERYCSDEYSLLFSPDASIMKSLCNQMMIDCTNDGRSSQFWTGYSISNESDMLLNRNKEADTDLVLARSRGVEVDECVLADFKNKQLNASTCGGYCVTPGTTLSNTAKSPACNADGGRLAVKRRPFICEMLRKEEVFPMGRHAKRELSYFDDKNVKRCATVGQRVDGYDMWNTSAWDEPIQSWMQCEGLCRAIPGCNGFVFEPPSCNIVKEEADKGWTPAEVMSHAMRLVSESPKPSLDEECKVRCASNKECNINSNVKNGVCYLKSDSSTRPNVLQWNQSIVGPTDCADETPPSRPKTNKCPAGYSFYEGGGASICIAIGFDVTSAPQAHRKCLMSGGTLATPKTFAENRLVLRAFCVSDEPASCIVPRGDSLLDGVYFFGLGADTPWDHDGWHWVDGSALEYERQWGGQPGNPPLVYGGWPTTQPDNTSKNQLCSYFYPRDSPTQNVNGYWGDEDCDTKCLEPASPNLVMTHSPLCNEGRGRITTLGRRYVCTAVPKVA